MKMPILITGGSGLLAVNWAATVKSSYSVTLGLHNRHIFLEGVDSRFVNLDSTGAIENAIQESGALAVVHCAAMANVEACESSPEAAHYANVQIASNVADACQSQSTKLVHISTDHLFSGIHSMMDEHAKIEPVNVYGNSKAKGEVAILELCPDAIVVRTNFFGWGLPYRRSFSDNIIFALQSGREIGLFCDAFFTPILMDALIYSTHALIKKGAKGIFNVVGNERLSKYDFGRSIANNFSLDIGLIKPTYLRARQDLVRRPLDLSLSNRKLRETLFADSPNLNLDSQLKLMLQQRPVQVSVL